MKPTSGRTPSPGLCFVLALLALAFAGGLRAQAKPAPAVPAVAVVPAAPGVAVFAADQLPAAGRQATLLTVPAPGRYSVRVESKSGVALRIVDRMSGWSEPAGAAGERDGRIDFFLDRGTVRVVTEGAKLARGVASLRALPFTETHPEPLPRLPENGLLTETLGDLESASWWIEIDAPRTLAVEAAGRHLADLRLWRDGEWLVGSEPRRSTRTPEPARPLTVLQLAARLEPGRYRLSAYGGAPQPWGRDSAETVPPAVSRAPLHLRVGVPRLAETGRAWHAVSPFGYDRFLVPARADFARLELAKPGEATLEMWDWSSDQPFPEAGEARRTEIGKESVPPVVEMLSTAADSGDRLLTVAGAAGQAYVLQHGVSIATDEALGGRQGEFWISTLGAGAAGDSLEPTGFVVRRHGDGRGEILASHAVVLSKARGWARRFNLDGEATLHLDVREAGEYDFEAHGLPVQARLEPVQLGSRGSESPRARALPSSWSLPVGLYVLTLTSAETGAVAVAAKPRGRVDPALDWVGSGGSPPPVGAGSGAAQFGIVRLAPREAISLVSNKTGALLGLQLRKSPVDLSEPLAISLAPAEELPVRIKAMVGGRVTAITDAGSPWELAIDGGPWQAAADVAAGVHEARLRNTGAAPAIASLALAPAAPEPLPPTTATSPPSPAPELAADEARALDLERGGSGTFVVRAPEPALYRLESSGLLRTAGLLRTRVAPALASAQENGSGRNFLLSTFLRQGDYQLQVQALGDSAGHGTVALHRAAVRDGGELRDGLPARSWLGGGEAVSYRLRISEPGRYRVRADGLRAPFDFRLEDAEGWPVAEPLANGDLEVELEPGEYRLLVLPQTVGARSLVSLRHLRAEPAREGHGPHALALGETAHHTWLEPAGDGERLPDLWRFVLPAPATVTVALDGEMAAEILPASGGDAVARVQPGRGFRGPLEAGEWLLAARCSRRNNRVAYALRVATEELVEGTEQNLALPALLPVSIAAEADYEIESSGPRDVRARLLDESGRLLAASDDRPGDWNFLIARRLAAGRYQLRVDAVGAARGASTVALRARPQVEVEALRLPARRSLEAGDAQVVVPVEIPATADALAAALRASAGVGLEIERHENGAWHSLAHDQGTAPLVALPIAPGDGAHYRLRLRALDRRPLSVELTAWAGRAPRAGEGALAKGLRLRALPQPAPPVALAAVDVGTPGCFAVSSPPEDLALSPGAGAAFSETGATWSAPDATLWLLAPGGEQVVTARRARLSNQDRLPIRISGTPLTCDLAAARGPRWVRVATVGGGEPLVALGSALDASFVGERESIALDAGGADSTAEIWTGDAARAEATLESRVFPPAASETLGWGGHRVPLAPDRASLYDLPAGAKKIRLSLGPNAAALLLRRGVAAGALWAQREPIEETRAIDADQILLLPTGDEATRAHLEVLPEPTAANAPRLSTATRRFESRFANAGWTRLAVDSGAPGRRLRVRGARRAVLLGADGSLARGDDLAAPAGGGVLWIEHGDGLVAAWLTGGADEDLAAWGFSGAPAAALDPPATLSLDGGERRFRLDAAGARLLTVRPSAPLAAALVMPTTTRFGVLADAEPFIVYLPPGPAELALRGLAGEPLTGSIEVIATPPAQLAEGLAEPALLAAGGASAYRFRVERAARVGVGVSADDAGVEMAVFDAQGNALGRGVVAWLDLEPGDYALVLLAPLRGGPVTARAALVGTLPPGHEPPQDEARQILARLGGVEASGGATPFQPAPLAVLLGADDVARTAGEDEGYEGREEMDSESYDESYDESGEAMDESEADVEGDEE